MYCNQCGFNIGTANFCPACGQPAKPAGSPAQHPSQPMNQPMNQSVNQDTTTTVNTFFGNSQVAAPSEGNSFWWGVLCFIVPILGIILYFVWRQKFPKRARVCLICGIISFTLNMIFMFIGEDFLVASLYFSSL